MKTNPFHSTMKTFNIFTDSIIINTSLHSVNAILKVKEVFYFLPITLYFLPLTGFPKKILLFFVLINIFSYFCKKIETIFLIVLS